MPKFIIISRQTIERELIVRAATASEAMKLVRDNVETTDFFSQVSTEQHGIIASSDITVLDNRYRHGGRDE